MNGFTERHFGSKVLNLLSYGFQWILLGDILGLVMSVLYSTALTIITISSLALNILILLIFFRLRKRLDFRDIILVNLAVSDLFQAILGYPLEIAAINTGVWTYGSTACIFTGFSVTFLGLVSISHLVALAIDRYISISKPFLAEKLYSRAIYAILISMVCWLYAFFWAVLPVFGISSYSFEGKDRCSVNWKGKFVQDVTYIALLFIFCYLLPVISMTAFFILIAKELRRMRRSAEVLAGHESNIAKDTYTAEKRNNVLVLTMVLAFLAAWTPYAAVSLQTVVEPDSRIPSNLKMGAAIFAKSSPAFNAMIYTVIYSKFQNALRTILGKVWRPSSIATISTS